MHISEPMEFDADPDEVFEMLTDPDFIGRVCEGMHAISYHVDIDGNRVSTHRDLPAPDSIKRFVGPTLRIVENTVWGAPGPDRSRVGELNLDITGTPIHLRGHFGVHPGGKGTKVDVTGELRANIPIVGKKVENIAGPFFVNGIKFQQRLGNEYLAER